MFKLAQGLELPPEQRLVLAIDTTDVDRANELADIAKQAGATIIKLGLEIEPIIGPQGCADLAAAHGLDWLADYKTYATPKTIGHPIRHYVNLDHPPIGITVSTHSGLEALGLAQTIADEKGVTIFGVGHLSTTDDEETRDYYSNMSSKRLMRAQATRAVDAGVKGIVTSALELPFLKSYPHTSKLFSLVVGARSEGVEIAGDDQKRTATILEATKAGADLIEIGRQVTNRMTPQEAVDAMLAAATEINEGLMTRVA